MKYAFLLFMGALLLVSCAESTETSFFVEGNCMECKPIIESAIEELQGIDSVGWDFETSLITVKYFASKIAPDQLQQQVANSGFNTQFYPADADAKSKLPACCQEAINRKLKRVAPKLHFK